MSHPQTASRAYTLASNLEAQIRLTLSTLSELSEQAEEIKAIASAHERGDVRDDWDVDTFPTRPDLDIAYAGDGSGEFVVLCRGCDITSFIATAIYDEAARHVKKWAEVEHASAPYLLPSTAARRGRAELQSA